MSKRILFVVGSGMGNQAETISALVLAKRHYGDRIDVANSFPYAFDITKVLFGDLVENIMLAKEVVSEDYEGQICTYFAHEFPIHGIRHMTTVSRRSGWSEVEHNMRFVGASFSDDDYCDFGDAMSSIAPRPDTPDVLIHNGYNKASVHLPDKWKAKSYKHWPKVVEELKAKGYTVGAVGTADETIEGAENLCGMAFEDSVAAIKGCKVLLSNDTGTYHVANVVGTPNVAVFTFTDRTKNYDPRFHRLTKLVHPDLPCSPCQFNGELFWFYNRSKCKWACRNINPEIIVEAAEGWLKDST